MAVDLAHNPPKPSPLTSLTISQKAPSFVREATSYPWPLSLILSSESQDQWTTIENLYMSCLRTGDDESARKLLDKLIARFGEKNERVMAYQGMWAEAHISNEKDFVNVLKEYGEALEQDPTNIHLQKRRIALLRSMGRTVEATQQLVNLVEFNPTDAEAWAELASLYVQQNMYEQAIFALEEVLLIMPNAWNMHARLAEIIYQSTNAKAESASALDTARGYAEAMRRYCRSIELCDDYLRGYYGLKLSTKKLLEVLPNTGPTTGAPSKEKVEKLNELATTKLAEIVRIAKDKTSGYDEAEVRAARELLDRDAEKVAR
ncbi:uncharacterized protein PV09_06921 [Verruconis gallopava]|uniref:ER membrane protein complex subunit 2 n=1 Tax=Verruconis gallopava TaxID=253628 RepID=A0A0D2A5C9_9PEZI|nr:uncharacterized protein PV09_06921 [Verruconis gallopava]KIW01745.1 hypothetical protein PV09_06921 [Verruconis gallopava]